jgi:hypothetical protein
MLKIKIDRDKNVERARHVPKPEYKKILNIYKGIDRDLRSRWDSNLWKEVVNFVVSVS